MLKLITTLVIASTTLLVGCNTTEQLSMPTDASDAVLMLEECVYSSKAHDERLIDSLRYFHQQEQREETINLEFVQNELHYCRTGSDLY